jgi:hypothetical protein
MILCSAFVISHPVRGQVTEDAITIDWRDRPERQAIGSTYGAIGPDRSADDRPITTGMSRRASDDGPGFPPLREAMAMFAAVLSVSREDADSLIDFDVAFGTGLARLHGMAFK